MAKKAEKKLVDAFIEGDNLILYNVPVKWAYVHEPDTRWKPTWKINCVLNEEQRKKMSEAGFNVRQDTDGDWYVQAYRYTTTMAGKALSAPKVVDKDLLPFTENIGNGSICNVQVYAKYKEIKGETKLPAYLNSIQVIKHKPYTSSTAFEVVTDDTDVPF